MRRSPALLAGLFDYAGLFAPASQRLDMALASYAGYHSGPDAWLLGRFVVSAGQLPAVSEHAAILPDGDDDVPWRLSALVGQDVDGDGTLVDTFNARHARGQDGGAIVDTVELGVGSASDLHAARHWASRGFEVYCEVPSIGDQLEARLDAIARSGLHAKLRTGGVTPESVPTPELVAAFLCGCVARGVVAKATAGLHHALTGNHGPESAPAHAPARMLGFVNVVLAAGVAAGAGRAAAQSPEIQATVAHLLALSTPPTWVGRDGVEWRGPHGPVIEGPLEAFAVSGRALIRSIGTCSFAEPVDDARRIGLLS